jgi:hypothetical protein
MSHNGDGSAYGRTPKKHFVNINPRATNVTAQVPPDAGLKSTSET